MGVLPGQVTLPARVNSEKKPTASVQLATNNINKFYYCFTSLLFMYWDTLTDIGHIKVCCPATWTQLTPVRTQHTSPVQTTGQTDCTLLTLVLSPILTITTLPHLVFTVKK